MVEAISRDYESWSEKTKEAGKRARQAGFDVERIFFMGQSLEEAVHHAATTAIDVRKMAEQIGRKECVFLEIIRDCLASDLELWWDSTGAYRRPASLSSLALSFLYLFPDLWKATNKQLSLDKINALDLDDLLLDRRDA